MLLDFSPTREHRKSSGTIRTIYCTNRSVPRFLGKSREELVHFLRCMSHELGSRQHRALLDLVATAFCPARVLVDDTALTSRRKTAKHALRVAREVAKNVSTRPIRKATRLSNLVVTQMSVAMRKYPPVAR
jgi:hypothetical protein